jgi:hypothetical protein
MKQAIRREGPHPLTSAPRGTSTRMLRRCLLSIRELRRCRWSLRRIRAKCHGCLRPVRRQHRHWHLCRQCQGSHRLPHCHLCPSVRRRRRPTTAGPSLFRDLSLDRYFGHRTDQIGREGRQRDHRRHRDRPSSADWARNFALGYPLRKAPRGFATLAAGLRRGAVAACNRTDRDGWSLQVGRMVQKR